MNCNDAQVHLDDYLDGYLSAEQQQAIRQHLRLCRQCSDALDQVRELRTRLQALPVPKPSAGFYARALTKANQPVRPRWRQHALAASVLALTLSLGIALGHLSDKPFSEVHAVELALNQPQTVNLVFNSPQAFERTHFAMELPQGVELVGYPRQHKLDWEGELKAGRNLLALPVVAHNGRGGEIIARIQHGNVTKVFKLQLEVKSGELS